MNYRRVLRQMGLVLIWVGAVMSLSFGWALADGGEGGSGSVFLGLAVSVGAFLLAGFLMYWPNRGDRSAIYRKEALAMVGLSWLICGVLGSGAYIFSGVLAGEGVGWFDVSCSGLFESFSGFSTTGASVFGDVESLPRAILFWRGLSNFLGGLGVVMMFVAVLGQTGSAGKFLFSSEVHGFLVESMRPRIRETAIMMLKVYVGLCLVESVLLRWQGVSWFECLCHSFATVSTGGFSPLNGNIGEYHSLSIEVTVMVFMIFAGMNFYLHGALLRRRWPVVLRNSEFLIFLGVILAVTGLVTLDLYFSRDGFTFKNTMRQAAFQAVSCLTTTGFHTQDFNSWPSFSRWLLVLLMFIGGSACSVGGGLKVLRVMMFVRLALQEVERTFRPHVVRPLRIDGRPIDDDVRRSVCFHVGLVLAVFFVSTILLMVLQNEFMVGSGVVLDSDTAFTAVAATLNNVGPGLGLVGPGRDYSFFTGPAKLLLSFLMVFGRLEIMVLLCLFSGKFWQRS